VHLFLDLHVSGRAIGGPLRADGHDVVVGAEDPRYSAMPDGDLLRAATAADRIVVTFDTGYVQLARACAAEGIDHAGVILVVGMEQHDFGPVLRSIRAALTERPRQDDWRNLLAYAGRSPA
jgi:hypothetical protein